MYKLTKNFRFESAHRLAKGYEGKCKNIHGHSWNGVIEVEVEEQDDMGFAVDFKDLGKYAKLIEDWLDHKILLWNQDHGIVNLCTANNWDMVLFDTNPTCETIARVLYHRVATQIWNDVGLRQVRVTGLTIKETCTTGCTYYE